jgi:hypothetical protein
MLVKLIKEKRKINAVNSQIQCSLLCIYTLLSLPIHGPTTDYLQLSSTSAIHLQMSLTREEPSLETLWFKKHKDDG